MHSAEINTDVQISLRCVGVLQVYAQLGHKAVLFFSFLKNFYTAFSLCCIRVSFSTPWPAFVVTGFLYGHGEEDSQYNLTCAGLVAKGGVHILTGVGHFSSSSYLMFIPLAYLFIESSLGSLWSLGFSFFFFFLFFFFKVLLHSGC